MATTYLIGMGAGAVSGLLFASAVSGSILLGVLLHLLAPLPMLLAGFGWGIRASAAAVLTGALIVAIAANSLAGVYFVVWPGVPVLLLCYLTFLNRPLPASGDGIIPDASPVIEWYPVGRIVAWATGLTAILAIVLVMTRGLDIEAQREAMRPQVEMILKLLPALTKDKPLAPAEINRLAEVMVYFQPLAIAVILLMGTITNMWLAGRITLASGRLMRPWPDIAAMTYPAGFALGLAVALLLSFTTTPMLKLTASAMTGAFMFAYGLLGLAVLHYVTRGSPWRAFLLAAVYFSLLYISAIGFVALAILGLGDSLFGFRRHFGQNRGPPARSD